MMGTALLEASDVRQTYHVGQGMFTAGCELRALDGLSLRLEKGEVLGVVGESGCGKSTLGRILLGLERPTSGDVRLDGICVSRLRRIEVARRIQPIFQDPYSSLNPRKRVADIVGLPLVVHGIGRADERRERVAEMVRSVGLGSRHLSAYPTQLSGGQRQRVAIARALIMRPEIVVCDEPTSALDVSVQSQILNLLQDLKQQFGLTYVLISHNLAVVEHIATRVAVMYLGQIVEQGDTDEIFQAPKHPYTRALLGAALPPIPARELPEALAGSFPSALDPPTGCAFHPRCPRVFEPCPVDKPDLLAKGAGSVRCHLYGDGSHRFDAPAAAGELA